MSKQCKGCPSFRSIANTTECGQGLCSAVDSFFPTNLNDNCHLEADTIIRCRDCDRYENDVACLTADGDDPIVQDGMVCPGYIDKYAVMIETAIRVWMARGKDYRSMIAQIIDDCENEERN